MNTDYYIIEKLLTEHQIFSKSEKLINSVCVQLNCTENEIYQAVKKWSGVEFDDFIKLTTGNFIKSKITSTIQLDIFSLKTENQYIELPNFKIIPLNTEAISSLNIHYSFNETQFGKVVIASTDSGVCYIHFEENKVEAINKLKSHFTNANFIEQQAIFHQLYADFINYKIDKNKPITFHLMGTNFQLKVWNALLQIQFGSITTYKEIANLIHQPSELSELLLEVILLLF
ncbi:MAG: MGMT family protein [Crocinitomicaceae bacterium]|nr:MGMT family protein [Crocinitomicaceae bacterium]